MSLNKLHLTVPLLAALALGCDAESPNIDENKNPPAGMADIETPQYIEPDALKKVEDGITHCADQALINEFRALLGRYMDCEDVSEQSKDLAVRLFDIIRCNERDEITVEASEFATLFDEFSKLESKSGFRCGYVVMEIRKKMIEVIKQITCHPLTHKPTLIERP